VSAIHERPVQRYSVVFGLGAEGQVFIVVFDFELMFSFLVGKMEGCRHCSCSGELYLPGLEVFAYSCHVLGQDPFLSLPVLISVLHVKMLHNASEIQVKHQSYSNFVEVKLVVLMSPIFMECVSTCCPVA